MSWGLQIYFKYFSWLTISEGVASIFSRKQKISATLTLSLPSDRNHHHEGCLYQAVTSKQIKLEIPAWSGFEGLEKFFPTIMWFFYSKLLLVKIWLTLPAWSKSRITHHHYPSPSGELNWKGFLIVAVSFYAASSENVFAKYHLMPIRWKICGLTLSTLMPVSIKMIQKEAKSHNSLIQRLPSFLHNF